LGVFGLMASIEKTAMGFLRVVLSLHRQTSVATETFNPFNWWVEHEQQFPNIIFPAKQILGIVGLHLN
jgi:hypothetical protein